MSRRSVHSRHTRTFTRQVAVLFVSASLTLLLGCQQSLSTRDASLAGGPGQIDPDKLLVVDCLLPGRVQKLGQSFTYLTPRRPIKTSARDCEIRGGEYTAYDRADYRTALRVWLDQAKAGDPKAQSYVGEIYEKGMGVAPDYQTAYRWYSKAARQGYSRAQINLGYLYEKGLGVKRDPVAALNWYRKASGLEADGLDFASNIEVQVASAVQERTEAYRRELLRHQQEADSLRRQLSATEERLQEKQQKMVTTQASLARLQEALEQRSSGLGRVDRQEQRRLEQQLSMQTSRLKQQRQELERLRSEAGNQQQGLHRELEAARQQERNLRQQLVQRSQESETLRQQLQASRSKVEAQQGRVQQAQARVADLEQQIGALAAKREGARKDAELNGLRQQLASQKTVMQRQHQELSRLQQEFISEKAGLENALEKAGRQQHRLQKQLAKQQAEAGGLQRQLDETGQQLAGAQTELERMLQALQAERLNFERAQRELAASRQDQAMIRTMAQQLQQREKDLQRQQRRVTQLEQQSLGYQQKLASLEAPPQRLPGPAIEVLDPPVVLTRSVPTVVVAGGENARLVEGKVVAPAGLASLTVNEQPQRVGPDGAFRTRVAIDGNKTPVKVVALDRQGRRASIQFLLAPRVLRTAGTRSTSPRQVEIGSELATVDFGNYYALIIGNQRYPHLPDLNTPVNDARALEKLLRKRYGFRTTLLLNADRYTILSNLNRLRSELTANDNLLIYYAGHGELDNVNLKGYWLPVDAEPDNNANWISNGAITEVINAMQARHVLVIADSCYSGSMTRSAIARLDSELPFNLKLKWLRVMARTRSRTVLTSGGVKPVLDVGGGDHSVFANAFLAALKRSDGVLDGYRVYRSVSEKVQQSAARFRVVQEPRYAPIRYAGHESGEFLFVPVRQSS